MAKTALITILIGLALCSTSVLGFQPWLGNRSKYVDTRIGTGGFGFGIGQDNPGPQVPFAVMRLGPDTGLGTEPFMIPFLQYGGYWYDAGYIECMSHTHMVGPGLGDLENFGVTVVRDWTQHLVTESRYRSKFSHDDEVAVPGYYAATLLDSNVRAEVTVSGTHSGMHRYTCKDASDANPCYLLVDVCHTAAVSGNYAHEPGAACRKAQVTNITIAADGTASISAWLLNQGSLSGNGIKMYFFALISAKGATSGQTYALDAAMWSAGALVSGVTYEPTTSKSLGVGFKATSSGSASEDILFTVRAGISFISESNAEQLLYSQQMTATSQWKSFEEAQKETTEAWETVFSNIDVMESTTGLPANALTVFYTAVYHTHCPPGTYTEFGSFLGEDNVIHQVPDADTNFMSDLSIWDIYRTEMPFLMWTAPKAFRNTVWSMWQMYLETGSLPKWVLANQESGCMVGHHSAIIMSDAVRSGVPHLDAAAIFDSIVVGIRQENARMTPWFYVPYTGSSEASRTLDYAVDAGAVIALAKMLGNNSIVKEFEPFADAFLNLWSNDSLIFCPRYANGTFNCPTYNTVPYPFDNGDYTEGDAVQYRWYVPHALHKLVSLFPSPDVFAEKLNYFFADTAGWVFGTVFSNPQFWAGNEPDILAPVLFPFAGNAYAYLTSLWFPKLLTQYETTRPSGLPGNDDFGTLSAWCAWGYLGIYPVSSTDQYVLFTPQFEKAVLYISADGAKFSPWNASGRALEIVAHNHPGPAGTAYLANASINGVPLDSPIISFHQLVNVGAVTRLDMYLSPESTVFGMPAPSQGGPKPYVPPPGDSEKKSNRKGKKKNLGLDEMDEQEVKEILSNYLKGFKKLV